MRGWQALVLHQPRTYRLDLVWNLPRGCLRPSAASVLLGPLENIREYLDCSILLEPPASGLQDHFIDAPVSSPGLMQF